MGELVHWIDLEAIRLLSHHASAVVTAVVLTGIVGYLVQRLLHDGFAKKCILWIDEVMIVGLFLWFAYKLFLSL
ncbi:MAG: hypothetical protein ABSD31_03735 [Candidatus Binataceae bacterium]|jgi:hypothetical protein